MLGNLSGFKEQRRRFGFSFFFFFFFLESFAPLRLISLFIVSFFVSFCSLMCIFLLMFRTVGVRMSLNKWWKQLRVTSVAVVVSVTHMFPTTRVFWNQIFKDMPRTFLGWESVKIVFYLFILLWFLHLAEYTRQALLLSH